LFFTSNLIAQNHDYLLTTSDTGSGTTTNNSQAWTDLTSVTVDVTNMSHLYLSATINMQPGGSSTNGREANYNIYQSDNTANNSGPIKRQIISNSEPGVESWGVGTLVHIFDVSALSGNKTFVLEHSNQGVSQNGRNVFSFARLSAVSLTTKLNGHELSNDNKTLTSYVATTSSSYVAIPGLETDAISLPFKGDIYVALSINGKSNAGGTVAEYKLEYSTDNGATYNDLGKKVKRSMYNNWDDGIVSMTTIIQDLEPGNSYKVRVLHERELGTGIVYSGNANLIAIALNHEGGGYFPSVYSHEETGAQITGVSTPAQSVTSTNFTSAEDIGSIKPQLFVSTQYLVTASGLKTSVNPDQRMRGSNELILADGTSTISAEPYYRYISSNGAYGAGGFVGLTGDLAEQTAYTVGMNHHVAYVSNPDATEDEALTTSEVILCGFQTFDQPHYLWTGTTSTVWELDANWAYGQAPTTNEHHVTIPNVSNSPLVNGSILRECGTLTVRTGASIQIANESAFQVADYIINNGDVIIGHNSSLLQTNTGIDNNSGTGEYTVVRTGGFSAYRYNIWSSPIKSASVVTTFGSTNPCDIWVFDENAQAWSHDFTAGFSTTCYGNLVTFTASDVISGGNGIMDPARGYFTPGNANSLKTFTGTVNNGDITIPIKTTSLVNPGGSGWGDDDWNLVGNPYPSALNATEFWNENTVKSNNITTGIYFWDDADTSNAYNQNSDYATWNLAGGINSGNSNVIPSGHIASGQGFWVIAAASTDLVFNNTMRSDSNNQFFKTDAPEKHNVWVSFTSPSLYQNNILVGFNENTTDGVDVNYDANKLIGNAHVRFASRIDADEYVIQSVAPVGIGITKRIPLTAVSDEYGDHVFSKYNTENLPVQFKVYLRDNYLGINHDLSQGDYIVTLNPNVEYTSRFELLIENKLDQNNGATGVKSDLTPGTAAIELGIDENVNNGFTLIQNKNEITITNEDGFQGNIQIIDITGKTVWSSNQSSSTTSLNIDISNLQTGIFILRITNNKQNIYHHKILKM
jgi:hypothetical protein